MTRITGGRLRGRSVAIPSLPRESHLRPTLSKVRAAIYNSLQGHVTGARMLDLFSGSGALGFEALSRDAESVLFVDASSIALSTIKKTAEELGVARQCRYAKISFDRDQPQKMESLLGNAGVEAFDFIVIDPPYRREWESWMIERVPWGKLLAADGVLVIEWLPGHVEDLPQETAFLVKTRQKTYGDSVVTTYRKKPSP